MKESFCLEDHYGVELHLFGWWVEIPLSSLALQSIALYRKGAEPVPYVALI